MFTGLIHEIGTLRGIRKAGAVTRLSVRAPKSVARLELGDSLAVNGTCLTVTGIRADTVALDAVAETRRVLDSKDAIGRRLDFLMQEFNREANTLGSKGGDAPIAHRVIDLKTELERIREQVQNVE